MRLFIYKVLVLVISLFFLYQFTIGYSVYKFQQKIYSNLNNETSEKIKSKIRNELKSGLKKDKILNEEDSVLLRDFFNKIKLEINNAK
tara:strand:- start:2093 stop:2356 length:264 start_codon:yes stop_codon:yes gene_type:complete